MARSINKAILVGNLGADPEVRSTSSGNRVAQFSLATSRAWTNAQGEAQERTEWHRVVAWGKLVDVVEAYLKKGGRVYVEGEIQHRSYEDSEGITRHVTEINARELLMLDGRPDADEGGVEAVAGPPARRGRQREDRQPVAAGPRSRAQPAPVEEEDLPF